MSRERQLKAILDPYIFWIPTNSKVTEVDISECLRSIDFVIDVVRKENLQLSVTQSLWTRITLELIKPLSTCIPPVALQTRITTLKSMLNFFETPLVTGETWGFTPLFSFSNWSDPDSWMTALAGMAAHWINNGDDLVLLTRLKEGRNLVRHTTGNCVILEKTRWEVYVKPELTAGAVAIPCISSRRNITIEWTRRYDDGLSDTAPTNGLAFIPIPTWKNESTKVIRTIKSKPTWVDVGGNGWSDTNTPGLAYHWDVFLTEKHLQQKFGGEHVNISRWGSKDRDRLPGEVHH